MSYFMLTLMVKDHVPRVPLRTYHLGAVGMEHYAYINEVRDEEIPEMH